MAMLISLQSVNIVYTFLYMKCFWLMFNYVAFLGCHALKRNSEWKQPLLSSY